MKSTDLLSAYLRKLGRKGGIARAKQLPARRRRAIAKAAARKRWKKG